MSSPTPLTAPQLAALSSPVRVSLFGALRLIGPQSIKELAAYLNTRPDALYYHVKLLVQVGVVEVKEHRPVYKRSEAVYGLAASKFTISSLEGDDAYASAVMGLVEASTAYALAGFRKANANVAGPEPEFHLVHGRLRPESFGKWKERVEETLTEGFRDEGEHAIAVVACAMIMPVA